MHLQLAAGQLPDAVRQVMQRDVHGPVDVRGIPFTVTAHVEDDDRAVMADHGQSGEGCGLVIAQRLARGPGGRAAVGGGTRAVDADPDQLALGFGDLFRGLAEQGQRGAPRDQSAQVGREAAVQVEAERAGQVPAGERAAGAQVDHPLPCLDAAARLGGVGAARRGGDRSGPAGPAALAGPMCA